MQQSAQTSFRLVEVDVVAESRLHARARQARLLRVDFPGMHVEDGRLPVARIDTAKRPATEPGGGQTEVATGARRQVAAEHARGRQWDLEQAGPCSVGKAGCVRGAVVIVPDRIDAGA